MLKGVWQSQRVSFWSIGASIIDFEKSYLNPRKAHWMYVGASKNEKEELNLEIQKDNLSSKWGYLSQKLKQRLRWIRIIGKQKVIIDDQHEILQRKWYSLSLKVLRILWP